MKFPEPPMSDSAEIARFIAEFGQLPDPHDYSYDASARRRMLQAYLSRARHCRGSAPLESLAEPSSAPADVPPSRDDGQQEPAAVKPADAAGRIRPRSVVLALLWGVYIGIAALGNSGSALFGLTMFGAIVVGFLLGLDATRRPCRE